MDSQTEIDWNMRGIVMDWLIEVHSKFRLLPETLFIATNLIDRFLSIRVVSVQKLQLVGITSLFVAAKYEEVICPSIAHFINMADGGYDVTEMLKAERYLLSTLDFDLSFPNPLHFLRRISKADGYDIQTRTVSKFLIEIGCLERKLLAFAPSLLAAAAMYLSRACLERGEWVSKSRHKHPTSICTDVADAQPRALLDLLCRGALARRSGHARLHPRSRLQRQHFLLQEGEQIVSLDWAGERSPLTLSVRRQETHEVVDLRPPMGHQDVARVGQWHQPRSGQGTVPRARVGWS